MAIFWGYDTAQDTQTPTTNTTLDGFVARERKPADFVFRYLCQLPGLSTALTIPELTALHKQGRAVGCIYNNTNATIVQGSFTDGWNLAQDAINLAYALKAPRWTGVAIDWEAGWTPSVDFTQGVMENLHRAYLTPIFYLNSADPNHVNPFLEAQKRFPFTTAYIWTSEYEPTAIHDTVVDYFKPFLGLMGDKSDRVVFWQYSEGDLGDKIDANTGLAAGMKLLWAPPPKTAEVLLTAGLKITPNHLGPELLAVTQGTVVTLLGQTATSEDPIYGKVLWQQVVLPSTVRGWLTDTNLKRTAPPS